MSNPFAMPESQSNSSTFSNSTMRLRSVGVLSAGIMVGAAGATMGLIAGGILFLFSLAGAGLASANNFGNSGGMALGTGIGMIVFVPIVYGIGGFIVGVIYAFIYNLLAGMTGGLELEFRRD